MQTSIRRGPTQVALPGTTRCSICPQPARVGGTTCTDCARDIVRMLDPNWLGDRDEQLPASIPVYWERLDPTPVVSGSVDRRPPGFCSTPPLSLDVVALRDRRSRSWPVVAVWWPARPGDGEPDLDKPMYEAEGEPRSVENILAGLVRSMWEHLDVQGPELAAGGVLGRSRGDAGVRAHTGWLLDHVDDITAHPHVFELHADLAELQDQLRAAAGDPRDRPIGLCRGLVTVQGMSERVPCRHPLFLPPPRPGVKVPPSQPILRCRRCDQPYRYLELLRMELAGAPGRAS